MLFFLSIIVIYLCYKQLFNAQKILKQKNAAIFPSHLMENLRVKVFRMEVELKQIFPSKPLKRTVKFGNSQLISLLSISLHYLESSTG